MRKALVIISALLALYGCVGTGSSNTPSQPSRRSFPQVEVPAVMTDQDQRVDYITTHFWDAFFAGSGETGPDAVLGVENGDLEKGISTFIMMLDYLPMDKARQKVAHFFEKLEDYQSRDTSSLVYLLVTEKVARYMYDPNSPVRSEDYYLPFVSGMAVSPYTREDVRPGYVFEMNMCSMNRYGEVVPDFTFVDVHGKRRTLHGIKAAYTVLFFSNPGCHACREIVDQINGDPALSMLISEGRVAVVNVYVDDELDKWREYVPTYPETWYSGYDPDLVLRRNELYNIRAIPSLYLLDSEKRVIFKDAPTDKVINYLVNNR